jgi:hypothetical protein
MADDPSSPVGFAMAGKGQVIKERSWEVGKVIR